ncbi:MAG TPA: DUF1616 domain-containing protein [Solirubrobacterales bacterium]|jgi:hypothetical protein
MRGHKDLRSVIAATFACGVLALVLPIDLLRLVFALPLTLFFPGYALSAAIFARDPIDRAKLLLLSVGASLAILALGGLLLNFTGGLQAGTWALLLVLVVFAASRAAALRRPPAGTTALALPRMRLSALTAAVLAVAALSAAGAFALAFIPLPAKHAIGYTELWLQPLDSGVRVGVGSDEQERMAYRLRVSFRRGRASVIRRFALQPGESHLLQLAAEPAGANRVPVVVALYRSQQPNRVYRRVSGWIPPQGAQP